jgi:hypothetical protein
VTPGTIYSFGGWLKSGGISQASQHQLMWTSTKTGYDTNNRAALPFPNYFTPSFTPGTAATPWTYVNRTFQMPTGIPNVEFYHTFTITAPGSGMLYLDNLFFRPLPALNSTNWTTLVPFGASWRYFTNTPPANWFAANFNDATWLTGNAKLGAGSGPTNIATRVAQLRPAYYFRKTFALTNANAQDLLLSATCTDDPGTGAGPLPIRVWVNGSEIQSRIETVTPQGNETRYFDLTPFANLLQAGNNTLAVMVTNQWSSWDDVAFDVRLQAILYHPVIPQLQVTCIGGANPILSLNGAPGTLWQIQSSDSWSLQNWQTVQSITNLLGGIQIVTDIGQNGRPLPGAAKMRMYRAVPL